MDEGALANQYQVLEELGSGSFGVVYKAIELSTGETVAIKHVSNGTYYQQRLTLKYTQIDLESSDDDIQDIQQEISVLSTCDSPWVTQYKTSFLRGYKLWIVMEYLGGGSCLDLLKPGPLNESHVAIICRELLLGLEYLHREGKIHRDVKAANVLLAESGKVKLADFGVAAQLTNIKSQRNTFVGTPFWMAPEVIEQSGYDFKADIWSLGITAMEMINAEPPNASTHPMKVLFLIPKAPAPRLEGPKYSQDLKDFVAACLVKDPDRRPTAKEMLQHRFIRNAGRIESLRELVRSRQRCETDRDKVTHPKLYEETLKSISVKDDSEDWVFDTVKAPTVIAKKHTQKVTQYPTSKRRKISTTHTDTLETPESMLSRLTLEENPQLKSMPPPATMRRSTVRRRSSVVVAAPSTKRRVSAQKQPLEPSTSFGNDASTTRLFRRVSDRSTEISPSGSMIGMDENQPPAAENVTKQALIGRRAYSKAIDPAFQETYAQSGNQAQREAISRVAEAWSALDHDDPEGEYNLLRSIIEKVQSDPKLCTLLPVSQPSTPQKPKLVLAQNNPHLKSHRRRQSSIVPSTDDVWIEKQANLPGQLTPGMEHTKQLADVLYGKWVDTLRNRWPALG